ncbi:MAG TPA: hypothetical protein VEI97_00820 [bacterium]|nr:hypothetical protein [bacterium]
MGDPSPPQSSTSQALPTAQRPLSLIALTLFAVLLFLGPILIHRARFDFTTDSFSYLAVAQQVARGRGLVLPQVDPVRTADASHVRRRPLTQWPPLYPLLCAIPVALGLTALDAASVVSRVSTTAALLFAWLIIRRHTPGWSHWPAALLLATMPAAGRLSGLAWSEGLACCCLLGAHTVLDRHLAPLPDAGPTSAGKPHVRLALWTIAGLYTRYAFLFAVPALALGLWWGTTGRGRERLKAVGSYLLITALGFAPWLVRNLVLTGYWDGKAPRAAELPFKVHWRHLQSYLLGMRLDPDDRLATWIAVLALALLLVMAHRIRKGHPALRVAAILVISGLSQLVLLVLALMVNRYDPITVRFLAPITVLLFTSALLAAGLLLGTRAVSPPWSLALMFLFFIGLFHGHYARYPQLWPPRPRHGHLARWMREHTPPGSVYAGSAAVIPLQTQLPDHLQLIGLGMILRDPERQLSQEELDTLRRRYGLRYLCFPYPPTWEGAARRGPLLQALMAADFLPPELGIIHTGPAWRAVELSPVQTP